MDIERTHPNVIMFEDTKLMPVNIGRVIDNVKNSVPEELSKSWFDPVGSIKMIEEYCASAQYLYFNESARKRKYEVPEYIQEALVLFRIAVRSYLCTAELIRHNISNKMLSVILNRIRLTFIQALIDPGTAIGIIAAQCVSEPMSQTVLDTKHRAGAGGESRNNPVVRFKEIVGVRNTASMKFPAMTIALADEKAKSSKPLARIIANKIEMMNLYRFVDHMAIFFEEFGNPVHADYLHEATAIRAFVKHSALQQPTDLSRWCIRYGLKREELLANNITVATIAKGLRECEFEPYTMYTTENNDEVYIRCYLRTSMLKRPAKMSHIEYIKHIAKSMYDVVVRGVPGIETASVVEIMRHYITETGEVKTKNVNYISTSGSNFEQLFHLQSPDIDLYETQTDSITEFAEMYGIEAARNKIIQELKKAVDINPRLSTLYADEMTYTGIPTSMRQTGLQARDLQNVTLRTSLQNPVQVIKEAAVFNYENIIDGMSGRIMFGAPTTVGTGYNQVILSDNFIKENISSADTIADQL